VLISVSLVLSQQRFAPGVMVGRATSSIPCCYFLGFGLVHADTVAASDVVVRRRAQANAPAASFWLRHVLDDGGRGDYTSLS